MSGRPVQFSVTRTSQNDYRIVVQDGATIMRSYNASAQTAADSILDELDALEVVAPAWRAPSTPGYGSDARASWAPGLCNHCGGDLGQHLFQNCQGEAYYAPDTDPA